MSASQSVLLNNAKLSMLIEKRDKTMYLQTELVREFYPDFTVGKSWFDGKLINISFILMK